MNKDEVVQTLKNYFKGRNDVIMAFLFGSLVKEVSGATSDIDIAVYLKRSENETEIWCDLERLLKKEVDLIVLNRTFPIVAWEAIRGIPLIVRDRGKYIDYLLAVSSEAEDLMDFNLDAFKMKEKLANAAN